MEFEKNTPPTDEERILAENKKMTVQPLNPFLKTEDAPAITLHETHANVERDSENTGQPDSLIQPTLSAELELHHTPRRSKTSLMIVASIASALLGIGVYFLLTQ